MEAADRRRRWQLVLPHRPYLVRIAMSRGMSADDAEDCAQEAMVRCVGFATLDESRVVEFLAITTMRLCVDRHRTITHDAKVGVKLVPWYVHDPSPEEGACDRSEAAWVASHVAALPESQRLALAAKAEGLSCQEIASRMGLSYKAVESLLSRARAYLRAAVPSVWVLLARARRRGVDLPADVPAFAMGAIVTIAALAPGGPAFGGPSASTPPPGAAYAAAPAPAAPAVAPARPSPAVPLAPAAPPAPVAAGANGPSPPTRPTLPLPTAVPTDPCDMRLPHLSTCVPVGSYRPGAGVRQCLREWPRVTPGGGLTC
ncbi:MAG TPA: sigma-70 family RNA polymerase sigma factor [Frankiaceae bacterium]|nr:sigma-70 family RNA polymerase sigma factor [Frankiaceae bacterium]